jgi:hypothetical protein
MGSALAAAGSARALCGVKKRARQREYRGSATLHSQEDIMKHDSSRCAAALCAWLLAGCVLIVPQRPRPAPSAHADVVLATERGMRSIVFDARNAYLSLSNTATGGTLVLRSGQVVNRSSRRGTQLARAAGHR